VAGPASPLFAELPQAAPAGKRQVRPGQVDTFNVWFDALPPTATKVTWRVALGGRAVRLTGPLQPQGTTPKQ